MSNLRLVQNDDEEFAPPEENCLKWTGYTEALQHKEEQGLYVTDSHDEYRNRFWKEQLNTCVIPEDLNFTVAIWNEMVSLGGYKRVVFGLKNVSKQIKLIQVATRANDRTELAVDHLEKEIAPYAWIAKVHIAAANGNEQKLVDTLCTFDKASKRLEAMRISREYLPEMKKVLKLDDDQLAETYGAWEYEQVHRAARQALQMSIVQGQKHLDDGRPDLARTAILLGYEQADQIHKGVETPIKTMADEWSGYLERIKRWRGRPIIGLETKMKQLTDCLCGLRGLILLAADTNVGKTLLAMQLAIQALQLQEDLCVIFVSIEMSLDSLLGRIGASATQDTWKGFVIDGTDEKAAAATEAIKDFRDRIAFLKIEDLLDCENTIISKAAELRKKTGCKRTFIVLDYIQVLPVPTRVGEAFKSDLDADRYRIEAMRNLKNSLHEDDAVLVISEVNKSKPSGRLTHKDIMGSARLGYAPDTLLFWQLLSEREKYEWFNTGAAGLMPLSTPKKLPASSKTTSDEIAEHAEQVDKICDMLNSRPGWLEIAKGRDGTRRMSIPITAYYDRLTIEEGFFGNGRTT